jgi:predicted nucleic acid-binding Zn ribbon protein
MQRFGRDRDRRMSYQKKGPEKIDLLLGNFLSERGYLTICKEYDVASKWNDIAGQRIANVTECSRVEDGVLYVKVLSAPWRQEISYFKQQLIEKIRTDYGCTTIRDIVFC